MSDPSDPSKPAGASFDIPDLDLGIPAPRPKPAAEPQPSVKPERELPPPISNADPLDYLTAGFSEADFERGGSVAAGQADPGSMYSGASLDLEDEESLAGGALELQSYRPPAGETPSVPIGGPSVSQAPSAAAAPHHAMPMVDVDVAAARQLAGYGAAPTAFYLAPLYSYRVFKRQRELRAALLQLNADFDGAELRRDEALAAVTQAVRGEFEGDSRFEGSFGSIRMLEDRAGERGAALTQLNAQAKATTDTLNQQIAGFQAQIDQLRGSEKTAADEVAQRQDAVNRVVAKQKRFLIEARAATQVAQQAAGQPGAPIPAEHAEKIQALQAQAAALQPEANQLKQALTTAQQSLSAVRGQISGLAQQARALDQQKKGIEGQLRGQLSAQQAEFSSVQRELTQALAHVGRMFLAERETVSVDASLRQAVAAAEAELTRVHEQRELTLRALDCHDVAAYKRGFTVAIGGVVGLVVLLVVLAKVL